MDFRPKNLFAVTTQKSCTDVFISSVYMFMLKQKEKIKGEKKKKQHTREQKHMNHQESFKGYQLGCIC